MEKFERQKLPVPLFFQPEIAFCLHIKQNSGLALNAFAKRKAISGVMALFLLIGNLYVQVSMRGRKLPPLLYWAYRWVCQSQKKNKKWKRNLTFRGNGIYY
jgi:hypothetical protein